MKKLYQKSEGAFALVLIVLYCFLQSLADALGGITGSGDLAPAVLNLLFSALLLWFVQTNGLTGRYGLCKSRVPARAFLWYLPLLLLSSGNLWAGVAFDLPAPGVFFSVSNMLCVGFLEELLFRGFLYNALKKSGVRLAAVVSSLTFGLGHLLNLLNGGGIGLGENLWQVCCAAAIGFLFVTVFSRGGSLLPCIAAHCAIDVSSLFAGEELTGRGLAIHCALLLAISVVYTVILMGRLPESAPADRPENP